MNPVTINTEQDCLEKRIVRSKKFLNQEYIIRNPLSQDPFIKNPLNQNLESLEPAPLEPKFHEIYHSNQSQIQNPLKNALEKRNNQNIGLQSSEHLNPLTKNQNPVELSLT